MANISITRNQRKDAKQLQKRKKLIEAGIGLSTVNLDGTTAKDDNEKLRKRLIEKHAR
ncbi:MAG: hypothetical protein ACOCXP_04100 [Candidatus Dojkabacteria bacterium]